MMISMPFKPKAQILLQLGEQLIKSESVAILELIKNAYDADAKNVSVSMIDIDVPQVGYIEIIDDGVGMNLWTVQNILLKKRLGLNLGNQIIFLVFRLSNLIIKAGILRLM